MKRIQSACLSQTIHFLLKEDVGHDLAVSQAKAEYENYRKTLDKKRIKYKITDEKTQQDGSIVIKIKKQVNDYEIGDYLA